MPSLHGLRGIALLLLLLPLAPVQAIVLQEVRIEGVEGAQLNTLRARLDLVRHPREEPLTEAGLAYLLRRVPAQVEAGLEPFGYYQPQVEIDSRRRGEQATVVLRVVPGPPVRVAERVIDLHGPGADDRALGLLVARFAPRQGQVLDHGVYEASKAELQRGLLERGYFRARSQTARVEVERAAQRAKIALAWDTGPRHHFGDTAFEGSHIREALLESLLPYRPGDPYSQAELLKLHRALADLDYFGLIDIQPQVRRGRGLRADAGAEGAEENRDEDDEDGADEPPAVPIQVALTPGKRSRYTAGLSYGTDNGAALRLGLDRRWVNQRGHKLATQAELGQRRSLLAAQYRIPALQQRLPGWWNISLNLREEQIGGGDSEIATFTVARTATWRGNQLAAEWNVQRERFQEFDLLRRIDRTSTLVYPALRLDRVDADDLLYPNRGYSVSASLRGGAAAVGSDVDFLQAAVSGKWIRSQGERLRWIVRGELGSTWSEDFDRLPPSLRYYAGGDRSVRGYGYQELAPLDDAGKPRGGRHLAVASAELERRIGERWASAVFVDAGDAFDGGRFEPSVGVGIGLRWRSPVGPVRLDIGRGLDTPDRSLRLHLGIGPEL